MKQARAIVPQAAFFVGSALALAQVALSTQKSSLLQPSLLENASIAMNRIWFDRTFRFLKEPMFLGPWHMELARLLK